MRENNDQSFGLLRLVPPQNQTMNNNDQALTHGEQESGNTLNSDERNDEESLFVDQPINLLSLMNTNHVIEERSNEDGGQSSS